MGTLITRIGERTDPKRSRVMLTAGSISGLYRGTIAEASTIGANNVTVNALPLYGCSFNRAMLDAFRYIR